ncbi:MAG: hypothetical protein Q9212_002731 [Teloschistes hypoglaucus]
MADKHDPSQLEEKPHESQTSSSSETGTFTTMVNEDAESQTLLQKANSLTQSSESNGPNFIPKLFPSQRPTPNPPLYVHGRLKPTFTRKEGFPQLACFLDSDDAFMVYRRFGSVFSRLLLTKQDEIRRMESLLEAMDRTDERNGGSEFLQSTIKDERRTEIPEG